MRAKRPMGLILVPGMFLFFLILSPLCWADVPLRLNEVFRLAVDSAPELAIARYNLDAAEAEWDISRGKVLPRAYLFGQWSENSIDYQSSINSGFLDRDYPGERYGFQVTQSLFDWSKWKEVDMQSALYKEAGYKLDSSEAQLLKITVQAYLDVLLSTASLAQISDELASIEQEADEVKALFDKGLSPITTVYETRARRDSVAADLVAAKSSVEAATQALVELIGRRGFILADVGSPLTLMSSVSSLDLAIQTALSRNIDLKAVNQSLVAAYENLSRERGARLPKLDLSFSSQFSDVGFDNLTSPPRYTDILQLSVNIPLFEGGAGLARIRKATADINMKKSEVDSVARRLESAVRGAWLDLDTATQKVDAAENAVESAELSLAAVRESMPYGVYRTNDVLIALANVTRARNKLLTAQHQRVTSWLQLELLVGGSPAILVDVATQALQ